MSNQNKISKFIFVFLTLIISVVLILLYFSQYWPERYWWISNAFFILPLWAILIPLFFLFIYALAVKSIKGMYFHCLLILLFIYFFMGFRMPLKKPQKLYGDTVTLRVLTINVGEGMDGNSLYGYIKEMNPDVVFLQELHGDVSRFLSRKFLDTGWEYISKRGLGIASRFSVLDTDIPEHYLLGARLDLSTGPLLVYTVHLETPRKGGEALIKKGIMGRWAMQGATQNQILESETSAMLIPQAKSIIVAGDFNLPQNNPIYKTYWSSYNNAFSIAGKGFGWSRYTNVHGVRIDHILTDSSWVILEAEVGPDVGGDHRPMFAVIQKQINSYSSDEPIIVKPSENFKLPDSSKIYIHEDFEKNTLTSHIASNMNASIKYKQSQGKSLLLESGRLSIDEARISLPADVITRYPNVHFAYLMLSGQPMIIKAKTRYGDWICLGATENTVCDDPHSKIYVALKNDGQWHNFDLNVIESTQTLLKANQSIQALDIIIPVNSANLNKIWMDDLLIYK